MRTSWRDSPATHSTPMTRGSVVKRPSGQYAIVYRRGGRQIWQTVGRNREAAETLLRDVMSDVTAEQVEERRARLRGTFRKPTEERLDVYARRWLERRNPERVRRGRTRLAPSTFCEYRRSLELHVLPRLGALPLASLTTEDVDDLIDSMEKEGKAAGTIRNAVTPLRKLLADAVRQGKLPSNPAKQAELPPADDFAGKELPHEHTASIREALVETAPLDPLRGEPDLFYVHMFDVALGTGVRLGELRELRWSDVDRERRVIRVSRTNSRGKSRRPKTDAGVRSVPLFSSVARALEGLAARAVDRGRYAPGELVFSTAKGNAIPESHLHRRVWTPALERAGLGERRRDDDDRERWHGVYRFHDLRHTCVSRLVAAGADIKLVQSVAGHANPVVTLKRYSHLLDSRVSEAADRFDPGAVLAGC